MTRRQSWFSRLQLTSSSGGSFLYAIYITFTIGNCTDTFNEINFACYWANQIVYWSRMISEIMGSFLCSSKKLTNARLNVAQSCERKSSTRQSLIKVSSSSTSRSRISSISPFSDPRNIFAQLTAYFYDGEGIGTDPHISRRWPLVKGRKSEKTSF